MCLCRNTISSGRSLLSRCTGRRETTWWFPSQRLRATSHTMSPSIRGTSGCLNSSFTYSVSHSAFTQNKYLTFRLEVYVSFTPFTADFTQLWHERQQRGNKINPFCKSPSKQTWAMVKHWLWYNKILRLNTLPLLNGRQWRKMLYGVCCLFSTRSLQA